jgi:hypothetical protein
MDIDKRWFEELRAVRLELQHGDNATQAQLVALTDKWRDRREFLRPGEKDETFQIVDGEGNPRELSAPRWLCHLLGLRHLSVHVLLRWTAGALGTVMILQVRSWNKSDSPGHLDISASGHRVGNVVSEVAACGETEEELGITKSDLVGGRLHHNMSYHNEPDESPAKHFYNVEWRNVYVGDLLPDHLDRVNFSDGEVVGLYLCPEIEAHNLLRTGHLPLASALRQYLQRCTLTSTPRL